MGLSGLQANIDDNAARIGHMWQHVQSLLRMKGHNQICRHGTSRKDGSRVCIITGRDIDRDEERGRRGLLFECRINQGVYRFQYRIKWRPLTDAEKRIDNQPLINPCTSCLCPLL